MSARTEGFRLVRESRWVKEYITPDGPFLDSKYRTFKCDASARDFIAAWKRADEAERADMEAAFRFYPLDPPDDVNLILAEVEAIDPERSRRMRAAWERNSRELTDDQRLRIVLSSKSTKVAVPTRRCAHMKARRRIGRHARPTSDRVQIPESVVYPAHRKCSRIVPRVRTFYTEIRTGVNP